MGILNLRRDDDTGIAPAAPTPNTGQEALLTNYSIEVMPRTAAKVEDFRAHLPTGTRVYIAHIDGTPIEDMVATAARLRAEGFDPMPHFPARSITNLATLTDWIARYQGEADVKEALILAGSLASPRGDFHSSMQLLETGAFDKAGFTRLHIAGHPEGNRDIDPTGGEAEVMAALQWKQDFANRSAAAFAIVTQFAFEAAPILDWVDRLSAANITMPVHLGVAGPAKLQTLIKYALACGVGASLSVLQKRAKDITRLLLPHEPDDIVNDLATAKMQGRGHMIERIHFFPLGGIKANTAWAAAHGGKATRPAAQT